jgi:hypothetical protein
VAAGDARLPGRRIVERRTHAARIRKNLAHRKQDGEGHSKFPAQTPVKARAERNSPYGAEQPFPPERIVIQPPSRSIEFNRERDAGCQTRSQAKEKAQAKPVANSKHNGVSHGPSKQSQRPMLPTQQIVSQVETPDHIQASSGNADSGHNVMVHATILRQRSSPDLCHSEPGPSPMRSLLSTDNHHNSCGDSRPRLSMRPRSIGPLRVRERRSL